MRTPMMRATAAASAMFLATAAAVVGLAGTSAADTSAAGTNAAADTDKASKAAGTGLRTYGITANGKQLLSFTADEPEVVDWFRNVVGLSGDTALIGIDFRVQDGKLYGVGNKGGIYTISIPGAVLTKVSQLAVALSGTNFGVDFNPAANRLRVVSDSGQNLRHNVDDGTTATDTALTSPPASGTTTGVTAAAYTNNDLNAQTGATLLDLNTTLDQVVLQSPANNGTLAATGALGVDAGANAGFDIFSTLTNGKATSVTAFASFAPYGGSASFYGINLFSGEATLVGEFPLNVGDIAVSLTGYGD